MDSLNLDVTRKRAGEEFLRSLEILGLRPEALFWAFDRAEDRLVLVLATELFDLKGPLAFFELLVKAYRASALPRAPPEPGPNANGSYASHVSSVRPMRNGFTSTSRGRPPGPGTVTRPAGTGTSSNVTSVPGIESRTTPAAVGSFATRGCAPATEAVARQRIAKRSGRVTGGSWKGIVHR